MNELFIKFSSLTVFHVMTLRTNPESWWKFHPQNCVWHLAVRESPAGWSGEVNEKLISITQVKSAGGLPSFWHWESGRGDSREKVARRLRKKPVGGHMASAREKCLPVASRLLGNVKRTNWGSNTLCVAANIQVTLGRDMKNLCLQGLQVISISLGWVKAPAVWFLSQLWELAQQMQCI